MDEKTAGLMLSFAEQTRPRLSGPEAKMVLGELEQQYGELLATLELFIGQGRAEEALRLVTALAPFWQATQRLEEGVSWFDAALELPGDERTYRGRAFSEAGLLAFWMGDDDRASTLHKQALDLGRQFNNPTVTALALGGLARIALRASDVAEAQRLCKEALAVTEGTADQVGRSGALHVLAVAAQMAGDLKEARDLMSERIRLGQELGNLAVVGFESGNLSMVERQLGNLERAEALAREALRIYHQRGDAWALPYGLSGLAAVAAERGEFASAATLIGAAEALIEAQGAAWPPDERPHYEQTVRTLTREMGLGVFKEVRATGGSMTSAEVVAFALGSHAKMLDSSRNPS